ncbi:MAG: GNAT family N-acetyltransferase [Acidimicrobiales bacterium]
MISFRRLTECDFDMLTTWLGSPPVQTWWRSPHARSDVEEKYDPRVRGEAPTEVFVVGHRHTDVGIIQRYRIADHPPWLEILADAGFDASRSPGIDYLLGDPTIVGRGIGTAMVRDSDDPSDNGETALYLRPRPTQ